MLVLSRCADQEIIIGENVISVKILRIKGNRAWVGVTAPEGVPVNRREVYEAKMRKQALAAELSQQTPCAGGG